MKSKNVKGGYSMSEELNKSEPAIIIPAYCPDARLLKLIIEIHTQDKEFTYCSH